MGRILSKAAKIDAGDTTTLLDRTLADEILEGALQNNFYTKLMNLSV
jgi:hypothetical protein